MNKLLPKYYIKYIAIGLLIAIFFILDRYLKIIALTEFNNLTFDIINDFFAFTFAPNYYIAFSLPLSGPFLNALIAIIIIFLIIYTYSTFKKVSNNWLVISLLIILLGALSNFIDRVYYGYVIDYFYLKNFTIFNLADASISIGALSALIAANKKSS